MRRFLFASASCFAVPTTSSIRGASCTACGLSSSFPASIFERSSTWLMRPSKCLPAARTRCSGFCAFSVSSSARPCPSGRLEVCLRGLECRRAPIGAHVGRLSENAEDIDGRLAAKSGVS
jgi:hypothetical protein